MKKLPLLLASLILSTGCGRWEGKKPATEDLGVRIVEKKVAFKPCSGKPNCVSSFSEGNNPKNVIEPIKTSASRERAIEVATKILLNTKGARLVSQKENYLHAEFTSSLFKFVDDFELYFGQKGYVHLKSASRAGYYDLGANNRRVEKFKFEFHQNGL